MCRPRKVASDSAPPLIAGVRAMITDIGYGNTVYDQAMMTDI